MWAGHTVSLAGSQVTVVALPLVAALTLGADAWEMGVLLAFGRAPYLVVGLPAGVWVDRLPRRVVLLGGSLGQALVLGMVPLAAAMGILSLTLLCAVAFLAGVLAVFTDIAGLAFVPVVVPPEQLSSAQGALEVSQSGAQVAGPSIAGWLVQVLSAPLALLADVASFLFSAAMFGAIRVGEPERAAVRDSMWRQIAGGAKAVFRPRLLRYVTLCTATHILFHNAFTAVFLLYLTRDLALAPSVLGTALAVGAVGGVLGSVAGTRLGTWLGATPAMAVAIVLTGVGIGLVALADNVVLVAGAQALMWFALQVYNVLQVPVRYALTPAKIHGSVNATIRTTVWGTAPIGALVGGLLGAVVGLRMTLLLAGIGAATSALWLLGAARSTVSYWDDPESVIGRSPKGC
ncbi:Predicted arabinose efflux permease, MFS family [Kibdelosporangium aridum]|uniref:Predicted arabinose efflux permease, MFS family n=1 Tax=Kibdelosporangium aridum TaxID=2030 RepID=A0A1W1ZQL3_KIBAR|nr:Predicted arabinose efflux permease, MFS family [Kibdelosporangium aridum]